MKIGKVYKIICLLSDDVYVGSTLDSLKNRFYKHKKNKNVRTSIKPLFDKYGVENFKILLIKSYQVVDRKHLEVYEQLWINKIRCINKNCSFNIKRYSKDFFYGKYKEKILKYQKKYRGENKENIIDYKKIYYQENKEKINKKQSEYYKKNKEDIKNRVKIYNENNKEKRQEKSKKYYEKNKSKIIDYQKKYEQENKNKINERIKKKIKCECGCEITYSNMPKHKKTKKHLKFIQDNN